MDNKDIQDAYRHTFATPEGQIVLQDMIRAHCVLGSTFLADDHESAMVAFREGGRNAVLRILALANQTLIPEALNG